MNKCLRFAKIIKTQLIFSQIASAAEFQNEAINNDYLMYPNFPMNLSNLSYIIIYSHRVVNL